MADLNWWTEANEGRADGDNPPSDWWKHAKASAVPCITERSWASGEHTVMNQAAAIVRLTG